MMCERRWCPICRLAAWLWPVPNLLDIDDPQLREMMGPVVQRSMTWEDWNKSMAKTRKAWQEESDDAKR